MKEVKILEVEKEVLKRIDMICRFACQKYTIKQGSIINIKGSNIAYVSPHIITIKENNYLIFNGSDKVFINDYSKCIKLKCSVCGNFLSILLKPIGVLFGMCPALIAPTIPNFVLSEHLSISF
jgi:hypothetical protein